MLHAPTRSVSDSACPTSKLCSVGEPPLHRPSSGNGAIGQIMGDVPFGLSLIAPQERNGLVVRVPGCGSRSPGSVPGAILFSAKPRPVLGPERSPMQ
jgi:hypothetical protein